MKIHIPATAVPFLRHPLSTVRLWNCLIGLLSALVLAMPAIAQVPDLTNPADPNYPTASTISRMSINLGPTGLSGWIHREADPKGVTPGISYTGPSRQILISAVDTTLGSPAETSGILVDDVILGVSGDGSAPVDFTTDARKSLALAIADAENRVTPELKLKVWSGGVTSTVTLTLQNLGAYGPNAPVLDAKCDLIVENARQAMIANSAAGSYGLGTLGLMALDDPSHPDHAAMEAKIDAEIATLLPDAATLASMNSGLPETGSKIGWQRGHTLITLAEYYLNYGEHPSGGVFEAIEAHVNSITTGQSVFGTFGHIYAQFKWPDDDTTLMMAGYGAINSSAVPGMYGLLLAKQCGVVNPALDEGIDRAVTFYGSYAGRGVIPYGEHSTVATDYTTNGKSGVAALALDLAPGKQEETKFFAKMSAAGFSEYETGHTGPYFQSLWSPLGAALGGDDAIKSYFAETSWLYDLARRWDGTFAYNHMYTHDNYVYKGFPSTTPYILPYALPLKRLHMTGRGRLAAGVLDATERAEAYASGIYDETTRTKSELIADLGDWAPAVQYRAAKALAGMALTSTDMDTLHALASDPVGTSRVGAIMALEQIVDPASAPVLSAILSDPDPHIRRQAAMALQPNPGKYAELNTVLTATGAAQRNVFPLDSRDPLQHDLHEMGELLFSGSFGILFNSGAVNLDGVDRQLLYPAVRAIASCSVGQGRSSLRYLLDALDQTDVQALGDVLVDTALYRSPADSMFANPAREKSMDALIRYDYAEALPVAVRTIPDGGAAYLFDDLKQFGGTSLLVTPDPKITDFCLDYIAYNYGSFGYEDNLAKAQAVLDAIEADPFPSAPTYLKRFDFVSSDVAVLTLPANQTQLHASVTDHAKGDLTYTWRKVYGAGNVIFSDNGTATSKDTTITFDDTPGNYLFEVAVIDARGLSEITETVAVTLYNSGGTLPSNSAPSANLQGITVAPGVSTAITLTGTDPELGPLVYTVTSLPVNGTLSGTAPDLIYTSDLSYHTGTDSFTFEVTDNFGLTSSATISITIDASVLVQHVYEPFDYPAGTLLSGATGGTGMTGTWADGPETAGQAYVYNENGDPDGFPAWDGVFEGVPTRPTSGSRYIGADNTGGEIESYRPLAQSAAAMAGPDGVLWMSAVFHFPYPHFGPHAGLALTTDCFKDRGKQLDVSGSYGSGLGDGIGIGRGTAGAQAVYPTVFDGGAIVAQANGPSFSTQSTQSKDYLIVLKFEFGATDTVSAHAFTEGTPIDKGVFERHATSVSYAIDETTLSTLTFSQTRPENTVDEIRIGDSFAAVAGVKESLEDVTAPLPDPMTFATVPTTIDTSSITMTAATATDLNGVEYYFICTSGNANDSGWQDSPTYIASGLEQDTEYSYSVVARDKSLNLNLTVPSGVFSATTNPFIQPGGLLAGFDGNQTQNTISPATTTSNSGVRELVGPKQDAVAVGAISGRIWTDQSTSKELQWGSTDQSTTTGNWGLTDLTTDASTLADSWVATQQAASWINIEVTNTGTEDVTLEKFHISARRTTIGAATTLTISLEDNGTFANPPVLSPSNLTAAGSRVITLNGNTAWADYEFVLSDILSDAILAAGETATFRIANPAGTARLYLDNIAISGTVGGGAPANNSAPTWAVNPVNEVDATEDAAYASMLADDASDVEDVISFGKVSGPGWLTVATDGTLSGTPVNADVGPNSFVVRADDGVNPAVNATLNIMVININDAPAFIFDPIASADATEDAAYSGTLDGSAGDIDGDALLYAKTGGSAWLSVAIDGTLSGTPTNADVGANVFTVSVVDGQGGSDTATLNITVINTNDAPVFTVDPIAGSDAIQDVVYSGTLDGSASDEDGDTLSYSKVSGPAWLIVDPDGALSGTPTSADVGPNSFTVSVDDSNGGSDTATLEITVIAPGSTALLAGFDGNQTQNTIAPATTSSNSGVRELAGPLQDAGAVGAVTTRIWTDQTTNKELQWGVTQTSTTTGNWGLSDFITDASMLTDSFVITQALASWINIEVTNAGTEDVTLDKFHISARRLNATDSPSVLTVSLEDNGTFADPPVLSPSDLTATGSETITLVGTTAWTDYEFGLSNILSDLTLAAGETATFRIANNAGTQRLYLDNIALSGQIGGALANGAPVASDNSAITNEDTAVAITLVATDPESDPLTYAVVTGPTNGTLSGTAPNLTYTPNGNYNGSDSFTFKANDSLLDSNVATISLTVTAVNDAPVASNGSAITDEDTPVTITLVATDSELDPLTYAVVVGPTNGTLSGTAPNLTYTPNGDYNGSDSFTFKANDSLLDSNVATISLTVTAVNDAPVASNGSATTVEDTGVAITLSAVDIDSGSLTYAVVVGPTNGTLSGVAPNLTYTPSGDFNGADSFTFKANDSLLDSNVATISITVSAINDAPVASDDSAITNEDTAVAITLAASDAELDPLTYAVVTGPTNGTLSGTAPNLTYTPNGDYNGSDSFTFKANDSLLDSNVATISITVSAINDAPVASDDSAITNEDTGVAITLAASDAELDPLTYAVVVGPTNGTLSGVAPNLTYTPNAAYTGADSFTFKANDGLLDSNVATISLTVTAVNDAPVALNGSATTAEDTGVAITLAATDVDTGDTLTYAVVTGPSNGTLSGTAPNLTYTPNAAYTGADSFTFTANDGLLTSNVATVDITVNAAAPSMKLVRTTVSFVSNTTWTTVSLGQTYTSPVIVATPIYPTGVTIPVVTRITNVTPTGFDLKLDRVDGLTAGVNFDVSIVVVDEGVYTQAADGVTMEAVKFTSTITAAGPNNWVAEARSYQNSYSNPVVIGQVMSTKDSNWSVFWSMGLTRTDPADASNLNVGKHVGQDSNTTRANETIGYIVIESGNGTIDGVAYEAGLGADIVQCFGDQSTPYSYSLSGSLSTVSAAVVSQAGMDGNDGAWAVLSGSSPVTSTSLGLHLAEDSLKDSRQKHTSEQVSYIVFE